MESVSMQPDLPANGQDKSSLSEQSELVEVICEEEPATMEDRLEFLAPRPDGGCALGCSAMNGRCWSGSVWLYSDPLKAPDVAGAQASYHFHAGVPCAAWVTRDLLVVGQDGGHIEWLSTAAAAAAAADNGDSNSKQFSCIASSADHTNTVNSLMVNSDGDKLVSAGADCSVCVYDCSTQQRLSLYRPAQAGSVLAVAPHPSHAAVFATTATDGNVLLWDTRQEKPASGLHRIPGCPATALLWHPNKCCSPAGQGMGPLLLGTMDGEGLLLCSDSRDVICKAPLLGRSVRKMILAKGEETGLVALCGDEESINIVKITDDDITLRKTFRQHTDLVKDLMWLDDTTLLSCGWDKRVFKHSLSPS